MSDSGASHIKTLEFEQQMLSRNSNGDNFSHESPIKAHNISRRSKLNNGSSRGIQMLVTFLSDVRFRRITYRDAQNWKPEDREKFKLSELFTRRSDSGAWYIERLEIEHWKLSTNSNGHNILHGCPIRALNISRRLKLITGSSWEI